MSIVLVGPLGITSPAETVVGQFSSASTMGFKNRIINGAMGIWQRGTSITVGAAAYTYTADRFKTYSANSATTVSRNTSVPAGFQYSLQLQRPAANTGTSGLSSVQIIETSNCADLAGQAITLSFWVKKGANYSGGVISAQVLTGTTADQGGDPYSWTGLATAINDSSYTPTTTWTKVYYTGTVASNVLELATAINFTPTGTAGADDSLYITGVQLEKGSTATSFDYRPYGTELSLCQRYYAVINNVYCRAYNTNGAYIGATLSLPVTMRAAPTLTKTGTWNTTGTNAQPTVQDAGNGNSQQSFSIYSLLSASADAYFVTVNSGTGVTASAEL